MNPLVRDLEAATDPVVLARRAGFAPHGYQASVLRSRSRRIVLNWSRQAGKSSVTAYLPIHTAIYRPKSTTLVLGPGERQAKLLLDKVYEALDAIGREAVVIEAENVLELRLANGSKVVALPGKEGTVRGYTADLVVIDEAARVPDALYKTVRPMLATTGGRLILLSTPFGKRGFFHDVWVRGGAVWERHEVPVTEVPHISAEFVAEEREALPAEWFAQEYLCAFNDLDGAVFSLDQIQRALSDATVEPLFALSGLGGPLGDAGVTPLAVAF